MLAALSGERVRPVPVAPMYLSLYFAPHVDRLVAQAYREKMDALGAEETDIGFEEFVDIHLRARVELMERYLGNCVWLPILPNPSHREIEACHIRREGGKLLWIEANGTVKNLEILSQWRTPDLWEAPAEARSPSFWGEIPIAEHLLSSERFVLARSLAARYKGRHALHGSIGAPFWLCYSRLGFGGLMTAVAEDRNLVKEMAEYNLATVVEMVKAYKAVGADAIFIEECLASADLLSPRQFEELALPYEDRLLQAIHDEGLPTVFYFCGDVMPLLPMMKELPWDAFAVEETKKGFEIEIGDVRQAIGDDRALLGNLAAVLVRDGPEEEIEAEARRQFEAAGGGPFAFSNGSPFTLDTPPEKVEFFCDLGELLD